MSIKVVFDGDIDKKFKDLVYDTQCVVDSTVLRVITPYVPYQSGVLTKSATIHTVIGSGQIIYNTPYARYLYYGRDLNFDKTKHPLAGAYWFDRMLFDKLDFIKKEAGVE